MSDKVNQVRTFEVLTATPSRRSPRHWSDDEKARLVAEAFSPGGTVAEVARAYARAEPRHPYTRALLSSSFAPDPAARRSIAPLSGEIPSPFNAPPGCAFAARCPRASAVCRTERPSLVDDGGHTLACFNPL